MPRRAAQRRAAQHRVASQVALALRLEDEVQITHSQRGRSTHYSESALVGIPGQASGEPFCHLGDTQPVEVRARLSQTPKAPDPQHADRVLITCARQLSLPDRRLP